MDSMRQFAALHYGSAIMEMQFFAILRFLLIEWLV